MTHVADKIKNVGLYTVVSATNNKFIETFKESRVYKSYLTTNQVRLFDATEGVLVIELVIRRSNCYTLFFCIKDSIDEADNFVFDSSTYTSNDNFLSEVINVDRYIKNNYSITVS